jgi:Outer membrane cobalamin receptor protein
LICFLTIGICAQNGLSISGKVTDSRGKVKGAIVALKDEKGEEIKYSKETDEEGYYSFSALPGKYILTASKVVDGKIVASASKPVTIYFGKHLKVDLRLIENSSIREEVSVIASGTTQLIDEVAKTVDIIDGREMRERADFALVESLKTIPGFRVQQLGGFGRTASIKTRGLRNQDTAVLIDGVRFRDVSSILGDASAFLSDFTLTSVSRVEVLRGSSSSLYGTNAIGGTIDFQTPKPQPGLHGQISGAFGGYGLGRFRGNISDGTRDGKFGFNLGVSRTIYAKGIDGEDDAHNTNFQTRIEYNPFRRTNISARFFVSDAYVRLNSNPDTFGELPPSNSSIIEAIPGVNFVFDRNDPDDFQKSKFFNGQAVLTHTFSEKLVFQGFYSGLKTSRRNETGALGVGFQSVSTSVFDGTIQTLNGHFNWTPNRFHVITVGYEYEKEKFGNEAFTPTGTENFFTRAGQSSNTFYAQDLISLLNGRLQFAGGFRAQFFSLENPRFSSENAPYTNLSLENPPSAYTFDGAVSYFFDKTGTKLRAHVGNGYRVPSLYERFGTFYATFITPNRFVPLGAPDLKPERTIAFDGGIEQIFWQNRARLTAGYFYTKLIDTIGFGELPQPDPFGRDNLLSGGGYLNTKGGIARGAEFSARLRPSDSTDVFASYTYTNSDQRTPVVLGNPTLETFGIPAHQFTLTATQRFERFWINLDFLATSDYLAPIFSNTNFTTYVYRFGGSRKADLTAGYTFPMRGEKLSLRLFGTVENLFDHEYYENGFRTFGRNGRIGLSLGF